jgi:hypothetical protein
MQNKIKIISILSIFMLIAISLMANGLVALGRNRKESPLYKVRALDAINEKVSQIKTKFNTRLFFKPFQLIRNKINLLIEEDSNSNIRTQSCSLGTPPCTFWPFIKGCSVN